MKNLLKEYPMLLLLSGIVFIVAIVGGVVTITNPDALPFTSYIDSLEKLAIAAGIFGGARALKKGMLGKEDTPSLGGVEPEADDIPGEEELAAKYAGEPPVQEGVGYVAEGAVYPGSASAGAASSSTVTFPTARPADESAAAVEERLSERKPDAKPPKDEGDAQAVRKTGTKPRPKRPLK